MALATSPGVVTNGLVFYYDMGNTLKSFIGKPVTNQFAVPTPYNSSGDVTFAINGTGTFRRIYEGTYGGYTIQPTDIVYRYNLSSTGGCHYHGNSASIGSGQYATFVFDYYVSQDATSYPNTNFLANFENYGGSALGGSLAAPNSYKGIWQTVSFTSGPTGGTGTQAMFLYPGACGGDLALSGYVLFKNPQCIFSSSSNDIAPFVNGTRSNTQSLLDLTGQNVITAQSLTYASDNTFSFNGTSNNLTVPFNSSLFTFNSEQTILMWMKNQSPSSARRNPYNQAYAGAGTITHENDAGFNYYYGTGGGDNSPYTSHYSPFSVTVGETAMIAITRNTSQTAWYKNGALGNTQSNPYGTVVTGSNNITIGAGYAGYFGGSIYALQLYNRALSPSEVQQNFNALRGRFGL